EHADVDARAARDHHALCRAPDVRRHVEPLLLHRDHVPHEFGHPFPPFLTRLRLARSPHSSEGPRPPCRAVPQNEISNLTVGKPIAISLAATGAMPNVGGTPKFGGSTR